MKISLDDARRVAELASLEFDEAELERMADEMSRILDYVDQLKSVEVGAVPDGNVSTGQPTRDDRSRHSGVEDEIGENAPSMLHGHFVVPKVIGGD